MESQNQIFDRRTLLAFALMFVVWFGWASFFGPSTPPRDEAETQTAASDSVGAGAGGTAARQPGNRDTATPPATGSPVESPDPEVVRSSPRAEGWVDEAAGAHGEEVVIRTPHYVGRIDLVGADLRSLELLEYDTIEGEPVELVPTRTSDPDGERAHALRLLYEDRILDLSHVRFEANHREIALGRNKPSETLELKAQREDGTELTLLYRFEYDRWGFDVDARILSPEGATAPLNLEVSWPAGMASTEPDSANEYQEFRAVARVGEDVEKVKFSDLASDEPGKGIKTFRRSLSFAGVQGKYFLAAVIAKEPRVGLVELGGDKERNIQTFRAGMALDGGRESSVEYSVFVGPVDFDVLERYDAEPWNSQITQLVDFGPSLLRPVSSLTLSGLKLLYSVIPNWGWTIILFSAFTKLLFYPLTKSSTKSMKAMQEIQPEMKKIREKYKDNQQKQSEEMMKLYKEHGVNPVGGCLPLLVQMPVFFALFTILRKTIDLRQADFGFWIHDLSRPDVLFELPFSLPFLGDNFSLLPFLMAVGMWAQTKMSQSGQAPAEGAMAQQMRMMGTVMPLMMFFIFYNSPSGLVLYWLVNTVLTAAQTWWIHRDAEVKTPATA